MRAIYFETFQGPIEIREVPIPAAAPHGAVIKVEATGLCRSDWHGWMGHDDDIHLPHIPGHEWAGVVNEVGSSVSRIKVGDRITVPFVSGCGSCSYCREGNAQVCPEQTQPGFSNWGSFAEFVHIDHIDFNAITLPEDISFSTAASLGCRFATAFRGLDGRAKLQAGEWVAILGCGGVGLSSVMIAKALGARVIAVDINDLALANASKFGAEFTINSRTEDAVEKIKEITSGGSHVGIDALGSEATANQSIMSLRRRGRHVQIGLLLPVESNSRIAMQRALSYELDLLGSHGMAAADYPKMLDMISAGSLKPESLVERTISLEEGAYELSRLNEASINGITIIKP